MHLLGSLWTLAAAILAGVSAFVAALFSLRRLYRWRWPVAVMPRYHLMYQESDPDEIRAVVTNLSAEPVYIVRAEARGTWPLSTIVRRHLRHPFLPRRLYSVVRYGCTSFLLLPESGRRKLEPFEQIDLRHRICRSFPLAFFAEPMFLIEVQLSTGRVIRSRGVSVPKRWHYRQRIAALRAGAPHVPATT